MTIDKFAQMTQDEFFAVRSEMKKGFSDIRKEMAINFATKDDLKRFATKDDLKQYATKDDLKKSTMAVLEAMDDKLERYATKDDLQKSTITILQAIDGVIMRFDKVEKDSVADKLLHDRHETALENHEIRIKTLEKVKN